MSAKNTIANFEHNFIPEPNTGCWLWAAHSPNNRYGAMSWRGKKRVLAHIISYQIYVGPIPEGLSIDHKCRNTFCVNPEHLEPVTHLENVRRGKEATKLVCKNGHFYSDGFEYYYRKDGEGIRYRRCLTCYRLRYPATAKI